MRDTRGCAGAVFSHAAPHLQTSGSISKNFLSNRAQVLRASLEKSESAFSGWASVGKPAPIADVIAALPRVKLVSSLEANSQPTRSQPGWRAWTRPSSGDSSLSSVGLREAQVQALSRRLESSCLCSLSPQQLFCFSQKGEEREGEMVPFPSRCRHIHGGNCGLNRGVFDSGQMRSIPA